MPRNQSTCVILSLLAIASPAWAQPAEWERAWGFREVVGLAPADLAALGVAPDVQARLAAAIRERFAAQDDADGVLIDDLLAVRREVVQAVSSGQDRGPARARVAAARQEVLAELAPAVQAARNHLPGPMHQYVTRAIANVGLDSPYRLLNLSAEQRARMLTLQDERDAVLLDGRQWPKPAVLQATRDRFAEQARAVLAEQQAAELDVLAANLAANLPAVLAVEMADWPVPPPPPEDEDDPFASNTPDWPMLAKVAANWPALAALVERGSTIASRWHRELTATLRHVRALWSAWLDKAAVTVAELPPKPTSPLAAGG